MRSWRIHSLKTFLTWLMIGLSLCCFQTTLAFAKQKQGSRLPLCEGVNLIEDMKRRTPEVYRQLQSLAAQDVNGNAVFWRVTGKGAAPSYLFGTFHSTDPRITKLPIEVQAALTGSQTVMVEIANLENSAIEGVMKQQPDLFFSTKGPKLNSLLTPAEYQLVEAQAQKTGMPPHLVPLLRPWFANLSFFSLPFCESVRIANRVTVLDAFIGKQARLGGKQLVGLESLTEQFEAFAGLPLQAQVTMLKDGIHNFSRVTDFYVTARDIYLSRRLGFLMPLSLFFSADQSKTRAALIAFNDRLIVQRNYRMLERALPLLAQGNGFLAVGALHLNGKEGLVALLKLSGYRVEKVF